VSSDFRFTHFVVAVIRDVPTLNNLLLLVHLDFVNDQKIRTL